jgi:hypothetical protein
MHCHPERTRGSHDRSIDALMLHERLKYLCEILRSAQDDNRRSRACVLSDAYGEFAGSLSPRAKQVQQRLHKDDVTTWSQRDIGFRILARGASTSGDHRLLACSFRQLAETALRALCRRQAADDCRLAACAPQIYRDHARAFVMRSLPHLHHDRQKMIDHVSPPIGIAPTWLCSAS